MDGSVIEEKNSKSDVPIARTSSMKILALFCPMKFFSPDIAPFLYKCKTAPYMEQFVMPGLVLLAATWMLHISHKNEYVGLLVLHLLSFLKHPWVIFKQ